MMGATLANGGVNPLTSKQVMQAKHVPELLAVMATAGLYDESGNWMYTAGLPAKSGVGGGIIAVAPGRFGIAVFSPRLERSRQQRQGAEGASNAISNALGANPYAQSGGDPGHESALSVPGLQAASADER